MADVMGRPRGGSRESGSVVFATPKTRVFRTLIAASLCVGLMIPAGLGSSSLAWADEGEAATVAQIAADQKVQLRQRGETDTASVSLSGLPDGWAEKVTSVQVQALSGSGQALQTLTADQYTIDADKSRITFNRTETAPIFSISAGEGNPLSVTNRWGGVVVYPQSKQYQITVKAEGFDDCTGTVTFYTGAANTFYVAVDENGNGTVDEGEVKKTFTAEELNAMKIFQNGSSQCGMTGFRTFSAFGVPMSTLIEKAGVTVSATDSFKLDTTDNFGSTFTYDQLFGTRYFLQSVYDDAEVKAVYDQVNSDASSGSDVALRRILAEKALEDNSVSLPMISANYDEVLISGDQVGSGTVPTAESVTINSLVGAENQYRFTYGIKLVQEDVNVTFDDGMGNTAVQVVKSHLMTSTENTTIKSTYWTNGIIITRNAAEPEAPSTAFDTISQPEDPEREGYTFAGWYTKNGIEDGDWGELFDFTANDGTADEDITLYAKWNEGTNSEDGTDAGATGTPGSDNSDNSGNKGDDTKQASSDASSAKTLTKTGDSAPVALLLCVSGVALLLVGACVVIRRRQMEQ